MGCPAATWIGLFLGLEAALECPGSVLGTLVVVEDEAEKSSGGLSLPIACSSASVASFSVTRPDIDQPTTFLWNASIAAARQSHPSPVPMQAMSPISTVFARLCFLLAPLRLQSRLPHDGGLPFLAGDDAVAPELAADPAVPVAALAKIEPLGDEALQGLPLDPCVGFPLVEGKLRS